MLLRAIVMTKILIALATTVSLVGPTHGSAIDSKLLNAADQRCLRKAERLIGRQLKPITYGRQPTREFRVWDRCMTKAGLRGVCGVTLECE